jgi:hypothetical protein
MRNRLEDLGRIAVMLDSVIELFDDFEEIYSGRNKDFADWFETQTDVMKEKVLRCLVYDRETVKEKIYAISEIAEGRDRLNEKDE